MQPNPQPHEHIGDPELVAAARRLDCNTYSSCLTRAEKARWQGFHCNGCKAYAPLDALAAKADMEAMAGLLSEACLGRRVRN